MKERRRGRTIERELKKRQQRQRSAETEREADRQPEWDREKKKVISMEKQ